MKAFLATFLLLGLLGAGLSEESFKVNKKQVVTPEAPKAEHPLVKVEDKTTIHNPENVSLSIPPKVGGDQENYTQVQTNVFDSDLFNFVWCRSFNQTVFAVSIKGTVFTSDNHGNDWKNYIHTLEKSRFGEQVDPHIVGIIQNERDLDTFIFVSLSGASWITNDCGRTVTLMDNGRKFTNFKFHPYHSKQILALHRRECKKSSMCISNNELMLSEDGGKDWRKIKGFVHDYDWGKHADYAYGLGSNAIFITKQDDESSDQPKLPGRPMKGVSTYFSWDFFKTETKIIHKGYKFWLSKCCIYVESYSSDGSRLVYTSEIWNNHFHWRRMHLIKHHNEEYNDFKVLTKISSFHVN